MLYAQVILCKRAGEFDAPLTYAVPADFSAAARPGVFVKVPLRHRSVQGIVVSVTEAAPGDIDAARIRPLFSIENAVSLTPAAVSLARFIGERYHASLVRTLRLMAPSRVWNGSLRFPEDLSPGGAFVMPPLRHALTPAQVRALAAIESARKPVLLYGVTGSGKTELYLRLILKAAVSGRQSILLVPEIALTPQTLAYFEGALAGRIAVFHSRMTEKKRAEEWWKVRTGSARLAIGSRSAIFAPVSDLGVVILDEEHEWTYKQESSPYYDARDAAEELARLSGASLIFGSATPRMETYFKAQQGTYELVSLPDRVQGQPLPPMAVVDLRDEFKKRNFSIFSLSLQRAIAARLARKEQTILFVNQRGMARAVLCRDCGHAENCAHCDIAMKYHQEKPRPGQNPVGWLLCHYCGYKKAPPALCPACGSSCIRYVGLGTQRVEQEMRKLFPEARVARADRDTTAGKEGFGPVYAGFLGGEYDVLVGTQMIAKGLDFPRVTLIGVVLADIGLHMPDFRSHERLFQLITQVAGRSGRGDRPGEVIVQTYNPDHFALRQAAAYGYAAFAENELSFRKKLGYPPFSRLLKLTVAGVDAGAVLANAESESRAIGELASRHGIAVTVAQAPAMVPRVAGRYFYHVIIKGKDPDRLLLYWKPPKGWRVDIDPVHTA